MRMKTFMSQTNWELTNLTPTYILLQIFLLPLTTLYNLCFSFDTVWLRFSQTFLFREWNQLVIILREWTEELLSIFLTAIQNFFLQFQIFFGRCEIGQIVCVLQSYHCQSYVCNRINIIQQNFNYIMSKKCYAFI